MANDDGEDGGEDCGDGCGQQGLPTPCRGDTTTVTILSFKGALGGCKYHIALKGRKAFQIQLRMVFFRLFFCCLENMMQVILRGDSNMLENIKTKDAEMNEFLSNVPAFRLGKAF